jgi:uncharacterized protein (TIGR01777 family)
MAVVLISGGTGLVGKVLTERLLSLGHEVRLLSRNPKNTTTIKSYYWNLESLEIDERAFNGVEHIVHLAGSGIADKKWTKERKEEIINSRVKSMQLITSIVKKQNLILKSFVGASAIGIYGMTSIDKTFTESDLGENSFLTRSCIEWEKSYSEIQTLSSRFSIIRIGVVLSKHGGALKKLVPLFRLGLGSAIGSGKQYMPWIHVQDLASIFTECLFNSNYSGVYNAVSSEETTNDQFSKAIAKSLSKPFFLPRVPAFILKIAFGEMASILLEGSRISNEKLLKQGFKFKFKTLPDALNDLLFKK